MIHVDEYVDKLINNRRFRNSEYRKYIQDYEIKDVFGDVSSQSLGRMIEEAKRNRKIRSMLAGVLNHVDSHSITYRNFAELCKFPYRIKKIYLSNMVHTELAYYQMSVINEVCGEYESFAWLFDKICCNEMFNEQDMLQLLNENQSVTHYGIQACIDSVLSQYGVSDKVNVAQKWLKKHSN